MNCTFYPPIKFVFVLLEPISKSLLQGLLMIWHGTDEQTMGIKSIR